MNGLAKKKHLKIVQIQFVVHLTGTNLGKDNYMMNDPESKSSSQEEAFEWVQEDGIVFKVTKDNSNGRKCECCHCECPCSCPCCGLICCTVKKRLGLA